MGRDQSSDRVAMSQVSATQRHVSREGGQGFGEAEGSFRALCFEACILPFVRVVTIISFKS